MISNHIPDLCRTPVRFGVVGGMGPETSLDFCRNINQKFRDLTGRNAMFILEHVDVPISEAEAVISGGKSKVVLKLLLDAIERLNNTGADFIVVPCNSVHIFMDELRSRSSVPIISIIEETAEECKKRNFETVGILATSQSINKGLHSDALEKFGIKNIAPDNRDQDRIDRMIVKIIRGEFDKRDLKDLLNIINDLSERGAKSVLLGCTDLHLLISDKNSDIPLMDTCSVLEDCVVNSLLRGRNNG